MKTKQTLHPRLCEQELQEEINDLTPDQRRELASKLVRWARQLRFSADVIELSSGQHRGRVEIPESLQNQVCAFKDALAAWERFLRDAFITAGVKFPDESPAHSPPVDTGN